MTNIVKVPSHTDPDVIYEVDKENKTCTCPAFTKSKSNSPCKHMATIPGMLPAGPSRPGYGPAVSALIKAVRMRNAQQTAYWYHYLCTFPEHTYRLQWRVVLIAAEDNLCVSRMERTRDWFHSYRDSKIKALGNLLAICKTPNWWEHPEGRNYIKQHRMIHERVKNTDDPINPQDMPDEVVLDAMMTFIDNGELVPAMWYGEEIKARKRWSKTNPKGWDYLGTLADMANMANEKGNEPAYRVLKVMMSHGAPLYADGNYWGLAIYMMIRPFEVEPEAIKGAEVKQAASEAYEQWKNPKPIPSHYLDGIHTGGKDPRFAGTVPSMWGMCQAFEKYGRLRATDPWPQTFWAAPSED